MSEYNMFVKRYFAQNFRTGMQASDVMRAAAAEWRASPKYKGSKSSPRKKRLGELKLEEDISGLMRYHRPVGQRALFVGGGSFCKGKIEKDCRKIPACKWSPKQYCAMKRYKKTGRGKFSGYVLGK